MPWKLNPFTGEFDYHGVKVDADGNIILGDDNWVGLAADGGRIEFDDQATDEINFLDCNVGIGTTSPDALLHVGGGNILLDNTQQIRIKDAGTTENNVLTLTSDVHINELILGAGSGIDNLSLCTDGTRRLFIDSTGNVGIGTATPLVFGGWTGTTEKTLNLNGGANQAFFGVQGNIASLDLYDTGGAVNKKWFDLRVEGHVVKFQVLKDDGSAFQLQNILVLDMSEANVGIGTATFGTNQAGGMAMALGTEPTSDVANQFALSAFDFAVGNTCPRLRTENGTLVGLNQGLLTTDNVTYNRLALTGGFKANLVTKTGAYTTTADDYTILCDASSESFTITLIAAASYADGIYNIKKIDSSANTVTVDGNSAETIDGGLTAVLTTQYESITIQAGSEWSIL